MSVDERFRQLCQLQMEGLVSEAERTELAGRLRRDPAELRAYVDQMRLHALLTWQHGGSRASAGASPARRNLARHARWSLFATAIAAVLMVGLMVWWTVQPGTAGVRYEVLRSGHDEFTAGQVRYGHELSLDRGMISFRTTEGAVVDVTGPARLELISAMHLRVLTGAVTADISEGKKGFVIETPEARVVDLGTRFAVSVGNARGTEVAVFEGKVEVYDDPATEGTGGPQVTLLEGEGIRIDTERQTQRLGSVRLQSGTDNLRVDEGEDIVSHAWDNLADDSSNRFYGLVPGGMREGAKAYTTRGKRIWHAVEGGTFPEELTGADQVCTVSSYRLRPDFKVMLQIERPCDLYVLADAAVPPPAWLQTEFVDTGHSLQSGPWWRPGKDVMETAPHHVTHKVWKRRIYLPGTVELGEPQPEGAMQKPAMYGIVVKPVP